MDPTTGFSITSSILTRFWIVLVVTASAFYRASITIRVVCVSSIDWSLLYFEVQEKHKQPFPITNLIHYQTWRDEAKASKKSAAAKYLYPQDEDASEKVDLDEICGVEYRILCEDNHSFVPINDSDVNPGIDADNNKANDDENEEDENDVDGNNNNDTLDDEDGGIMMNDGLIQYD